MLVAWTRENNADGDIWDVLEVELEKKELSDWLWGLKKKKGTWVILGFGLTNWVTAGAIY